MELSAGAFLLSCSSPWDLSSMLPKRKKKETLSSKKYMGEPESYVEQDNPGMEREIVHHPAHMCNVKTFNAKKQRIQW